VQERYRGWNDVFKENHDVKIVQKWFDDPAKAGDVVSSMLASNPDIKVLLIDWANPPANQAETVFKQRGLKPWKDIAMVTIDLDNTVVVPMAINGPDNNYTAAFVTQTWYNVGKLWGLMYAKHVLYGNKAPKYVVSPPLPLTTWENLKINYVKAVPQDYPIPLEVDKLANQWPLGVEDQWK
jgi:ABC-type sugar transport system substrate-binding protein